MNNRKSKIARPHMGENQKLRERAITWACRGLATLFDLAGRLGGRSRLQLVDLPSGARVLLVKPCCLGDVVLTTATLRAVSLARPDLQLEFLVSKWAQPAVEGNPRLTRLVPTGVAGSHLNWREYMTLVRRLRQEKYAAALVLDRSPRLTLLPWLAGIRVRAGVDNLGRGFALNARATQPIGQLRPEAEVYLDVARVLGVDTTNARLEYCPSEQAVQSFQEKATRLGLVLDEPIVVIHPSAGQNPDTLVLSKRWPAERFGEIASRLLAQGKRVVIIGAESDQKLAQTVEQTARESLPPEKSGQLVNACGQFNLAESGALLQKAGLFVGNDTGFMHLAVACGAPTVAVFGPSSPVAYGPYTSKGKAVAPVQATVAAGLPLKEYEALSVAEGGIMAVSIEMVWQAILTVQEL